MGQTVMGRTGKQTNLEETIEGTANQVEENLLWKLISYIFRLHERYEIKFRTKKSSFTVSYHFL